MTRLLCLVTSILVFLAATAATPLERIKEHRRWMTEHYSNPAALDDRALLEAASAVIAYELQEPEAKAIMLCMAEKAPGARAYAEAMGKNVVDTLLSRQRAAEKALADYAARALGADDALAIRLQLYACSTLNTFEDASPQLQSLGRRTAALVRKAPTATNRALDCLVRLETLNARHARSAAFPPADYVAIAKLEREVLDIYPPDDKSADMLKLALYGALATAEFYPADHEREFAFALVDAGLKYENTPGIDYQWTGTEKNYPCPSAWFMERCRDCLTEIFHDSHPALIQEEYKLCDYINRNFGYYEEYYNIYDQACTFVEAYYPMTSLLYGVIRLSRNHTQVSLGGTSSMTFIALRNLALIYGESNLQYIYAIVPDIYAEIMMNPASFQSQKARFFEALDKLRIEDPFVELILQTQFLYVNLAYDFEGSKTALTGIAEEFLKDSRAGESAIELGKELCNGLGKLFDRDILLRVHDKTSDLVAKQRGKGSVYHIFAEYQKSVAANNFNDGSAEEILTGLLPAVRKLKVELREMIEENICFDLAFYYSQNNNWKKCLEVLDECRNNFPDEPQYNIRALRGLALAELGKADSNSDMDMEKLEEVCSDEYQQAHYICSRYFYRRRQYDNAIASSSRAIDYNAALRGSAFDSFGLALRQTLLASLQEKGDISGAIRLALQDVEALNNSGFMEPSTSLLSYMWDNYRLVKSNRGMVDASHILGSVSALMSKLFGAMDENSAYSLRLSFFPLFISEVLDLMVQLSALDDLEMPEDYRKIVEKNISNNLILEKESLSAAEDVFKELEAEYSEKYERPYEALAFALADYYQKVAKNQTLADEIYDKLLSHGSDESIAGYALELGARYYERGMQDKAYSLVDKYLSFVESNPDKKSWHDSFQYSFWNTQKSLRDNSPAAALPHAREQYKLLKEYLAGSYLLMTEADQQSFAEKYGDPSWPLCRMLQYVPGDVAAEAYDAVLFRTGMQLRSQQETRKAVELSQDSRVRALADSIAGLKATLTQQQFDFENYASGKSATEQATLRRRIELFEQQLLDLTAAERRLAAAPAWSDVAAALGTTDVAVEFVKSDTRLGALVLRHGASSPTFVPLGELQAVADAIYSGRNQRAPAELYAEGNLTLYKLIWEPLEASLAGADRIYYAVSDLLSGLSFDALAAPGGKRLIDLYDLHRLTTTGNLAAIDSSAMPDDALLLGDIFYSRDQELVFADGSARSGQRASSARGEAFGYLQSTRAEIDGIADALADKTAKVYTQNFASEENLRRALGERSPGILHLATHGFYLADVGEAHTVPFMRNHSGAISSPMQRSGFALAGAEETWAGKNGDDDTDGIITASELAHLDLSGTRLAVISACSTALGAANHEGVFGLQRGLKIAGAKSLLLSLWNVDDTSTAELMVAFYRNWKEGQSKHDAFRNAVAAVRAAYPDPYHWAAFTLLD